MQIQLKNLAILAGANAFHLIIWYLAVPCTANSLCPVNKTPVWRWTR